MPRRAGNGAVGGPLDSSHSRLTRSPILPRAAAPPWRRGVSLARSPVALTGAAKACELLTLALLATLVPRLLGPADYGVFSLVITLVALGSLSFSLGGATLVTRFVPAVDVASRAALARAFGVRLARARLVGVVVLAVLAATLATLAPDRFPPFLTGVVVVALALQVTASLVFQLALALGHSALWSFRYPLENVVLVLVICVTVLGAGAGSTGAVIAVAASSAASLLLGAAVVARPLARAKGPASIPAGALRFSVYSAIAGLLFHVYTRGGVLAVAALHGSDVETGFAGLAIGVCLAGFYAISQTFMVHLPKLAERADADVRRAERTGHRLTRNVQRIALPATFVAALAVGPVLPVMLGEDFAGAEAALTTALAVLPLAPLVALGGQVAAVRLEPGWRVSALGGATAVSAVVAVLAVPSWGAAGATAALLAGTVATVLIFLCALPRFFTRRLTTISFAGAALVLALAQLT